MVIHAYRLSVLAAVAIAALTAATHLSGVTAGKASHSEAELTRTIDFNRDVRPILSNACFECHGPDAATRQADLRLDQFADATAALPSGNIAVVPGDTGASALLQRIVSDDPLERMPPAASAHELTAAEIETLREWIVEGAVWAEHWAFIPPARPPLPPPSPTMAARNPIDLFIHARLAQEGLSPSEAADRATLIRRASLDLTGLPPSPEEVDAFLQDVRPDAYERIVERLLQSPAYGEHMARIWLDAARYGDTHGLHLDNDRSIWPWRDWVINAYNSNLPFDQFTIEQLAGDLLPDPTLDQLVATGFNRNNVTTSEGGAIDEEYLVQYAADRVETTSTVWMGLTMACAQCHDHKFDPVSQREYYEFFAFFNSTAEAAMDGNRRDPPPVVRVPSADQQTILESLESELNEQIARIDAPDPVIDEAQAQWEAGWRTRWREQWLPLEIVRAESRDGALLTTLPDASILASGENPDRDVYTITARTDAVNISLIRLEALTDAALPHHGPGRAENANFVLSEIEVEAVAVSDPSQRQTARLMAASADHEQMNGPFPVSAAIDGVIDATNGWAVEGFNRRENRTAVFATAAPIGFDGGTELTIRLRFETHFPQHSIGRMRLSVSADPDMAQTFGTSALSDWHVVGPFHAVDGRTAHDTPAGPEGQLDRIDLNASWRDGALRWRIEEGFVDGAIHALDGDSCATYLYRTITSPAAGPMELSLGSDDAIKVWLNGSLVHDHFIPRSVAADQDRITLNLQRGENHLLMKITNITGGYGFYFLPKREGSGNELLRVIDALAMEPSPDREATIRNFYRRHHSEALRPVFAHVDVLRKQNDDVRAQIPTTLIMQNLPDRRQTYILRRGQYDAPGEAVNAATPGCLPPLAPRSEHADRLDLARWLVSDGHPLTARVVVNRMWLQLFGTGLVETVEDFGAQGQWPSHPEFLDWLAVEFVESGWDVQHMFRLMMTSATYMQQSAVTPDLLARDPENRLLARGPRFRLDAEVLRDQALAASGLLVREIGGPGVRPYQPDGLWEAVAYEDSNTREFTMDTGDAQYRRSMYTYWKRTSPPPNMTAFDAPSRETCTVRRPRTNTPLQSLVLLNDRQFVEAARALAQRALEASADRTAQLQFAFRLLLARTPSPRETAVIEELYAVMIDRYSADPVQAQHLLAVGDSPRNESLSSVEHAAMTTVVSTLFGLDEAVTKE